MNEFTNKLDSKGIYYSRYIASWANKGGTFKRQGFRDFKDWLKSLGLDDVEIREIAFLADNGKLELEASAKEFMKKKKNETEVLKD